MPQELDLPLCVFLDAQVYRATSFDWAAGNFAALKQHVAKGSIELVTTEIIRQEIWMAETRAEAVAAFDAFLESYELKYEKAADCLAKDRDALLAFCDFPAEHWKHLRTSNPIASTFVTVRHRTIRAKGCLSNTTALAMVFKLVDATQKSWHRLDGHNQLPKVVRGAKFNDGLEVVQAADRQPQAAA